MSEKIFLNAINKRAVLTIILNASIIFYTSDNTFAQKITPDKTLQNNSQVNTVSNITNITGGTQVGRNLFHSFSEFSLSTGTKAYFQNSLDIQNILARVTGKSISNIDGTIHTNGTANLFIINPNGIVFGKDAKLDIGGSFFVSTASSLKFTNGFEFSAINPQSPLLTINVPIGLQYGASPGNIEVKGSNLQVNPGKTFGLIGGNISVDGGQIVAPGGHVELGGLTQTGSIGLTTDNTGNLINLSLPDKLTRGDLTFNNKASVDVTAASGGSIGVNVQNFSLSEKSALNAGIGNNLGSIGALAGDVNVNANGTVTFKQSSLIANQVNPGATGNAGNINVTAKSLYLLSGSQLFTTTYGKGNSGVINVNLGNLLLIDGENLNISTSGIISAVSHGGVGNGGEININTKFMSVTNGAQLNTATNANGNSGNVIIKATGSIYFDGAGKNYNASGIISAVTPTGIGSGGDIDIKTGSLIITHGAQLNTITRNKGNAGNVNIQAHDFLSDGTNIYGGASGILSSVDTTGIGNGGQINITDQKLSLNNGAIVSTNNEGNGRAGDIYIRANSIHFNQGTLSSNSIEGKGNITVRSHDIILRHNSNITTNANGKQVIGGDINIKTGVLAVLEHSSIAANSLNFRGGNVIINTQGIFGTEDWYASALKGEITAKGSTPQLSGTIQINASELDPSRGLAYLPINVVNVANLINQNVCARSYSSSFTYIGRGGLAPNPNTILDHNPVWEDWRIIPITGGYRKDQKTLKPHSFVPTQIIEAQGWIIDKKGQIILTAFAPKVTPQITGNIQPRCQLPIAK